MIRRIKKEILHRINKIQRHTELSAELDTLKSRINRMSLLYHHLVPDILPIKPSDTSPIIHATRDQFTNFEISKNDLMFMFWLHHTRNIEAALVGYFNSGLQQAESVKGILIKYFNDINKVQLLDFASGHGRVSRHYTHFMPAENICISDIKQNAVSFQAERLGYKGFIATAEPEDMFVNKTFDLIIVSSLFTHLNLDLFQRWIYKLGSLVNINGILALSLHIGIKDFEYSEVSEDDLFPETSECLAGRNIYGLTSLSRTTFTKILNNRINWPYKIVEELKWGDSQILFVIKRLD